MTSVGLRFRIFQRDNFTCLYCGASPLMVPGTILEVDHIVPLVKGGVTAAHNLITACRPCNNGKRARPLSQEQIEALSNRLLPDKPKRVRKVKPPKPMKAPKVVKAKAPKPPPKQPKQKRQSPQKPARKKRDYIPVANGFVYTGDDTFNPRFYCSVCGFLNVYEQDNCSCWTERRRMDAPVWDPPERYYCEQCEEEIIEDGERFCDGCYEEMYCWECGALTGNGEEEHAETCETGKEETKTEGVAP